MNTTKCTTATNVNLDIFPSPVAHGDYLAMFTNEAARCGMNLPCQDGNATNAAATDWSKVKMILNVDLSGSMWSSLGGLLRRTLPKFFELLGLPDDYEVELIMFTHFTLHCKHKVKEFPTLPYVATGCERLAPCMPIIKDLLDSYPQGTYVRMLTFSDGMIGDLHQQMTSSVELYNYIQNVIGNKLYISSHAVRIIDRASQSADTRALSSMLVMGNLPGETQI
eukprot:UN02618